MTEWNFGDIDGRQLCLRWWSPWPFLRWKGDWELSPWLLLNPLNWWRAAKVRDNWRVHWHLHRECNHRCYCPVGLLFDGNIHLAGFGVTWFYSRYCGPVPCTCDLAMDELNLAEVEMET